MNTNEMKLLSDLSDQLKSMNITSSEKDVDADKIIQASIAPVPEALYKLVQVALVQHIAIEQLRNQVLQLKTTLQSQTQASPSTPKGFLDGLKETFLGKPSTPISPAYTQPQPSMMTPPQPAPLHSSGFLGQAMAVGAGVAGGMLLGNAIESLFSPHSSGASAFNAQPNEMVENNYNGSDFSNNDLPDVSQENLTINNQPDSDFDTNDNSSDDDLSNFDDSSSFDDGGSDW